MRTTFSLIGCLGVFASAALVAADPPYVGRWLVNKDKTDLGIAMTFEPTDVGGLRLLEGGRTTIVRFDGKEYPHPLGGVVRWVRVDERSWQTTYSTWCSIRPG